MSLRLVSLKELTEPGKKYELEYEVLSPGPATTITQPLKIVMTTAGAVASLEVECSPQPRIEDAVEELSRVLNRVLLELKRVDLAHGHSVPLGKK